MVHGKSRMVKDGKGLSSVPQIALVGCGYWGKNLCRNFHALGVLFAVVDATENGQSTARSIAPDVMITDNFEDILGDDQIQGVALATPAETHADLAIQAMHAGKDVFVEKPMALSISDAKICKSGIETGRILDGGAFIGISSCGSQIKGTDRLRRIGKDQLYLFKSFEFWKKVRTEENALWSFAPHDVAVILRLIGQSPVEVSASGIHT